MAYPELLASQFSTSSKKKKTKLDPNTTTVGAPLFKPNFDLKLEVNQSIWEKANQTYKAAERALSTGEEKRDKVIDNIVTTVKSNVNKSQDNKTGLIPKPMYNYVKSINGFGCMTSVCSVIRKAGGKIPTHILNEKTGEFEKNKFTFNNRSYDSNSKYPVFSGNNSVDELASNMGLTLTDRNTLPDQKGDLIRKNYDNIESSPAGFEASRTRTVNGVPQRGTTHATVVADTIPPSQQVGNNPVSTSYYNPGTISDGIESSQYYNNPKMFDNTDQDGDGEYGVNRVMRYSGNVPYLQNQVRLADKARNYGISPYQKDFMQRMKNTKPVLMDDGKITGNTTGLNALFKKLKKK